MDNGQYSGRVVLSYSVCDSRSRHEANVIAEVRTEGDVPGVGLCESRLRPFIHAAMKSLYPANAYRPARK